MLGVTPSVNVIMTPRLTAVGGGFAAASGGASGSICHPTIHNVTSNFRPITARHPFIMHTSPQASSHYVRIDLPPMTTHDRVSCRALSHPSLIPMHARPMWAYNSPSQRPPKTVTTLKLQQRKNGNCKM
jgi:hypothetical protein